MLNAQDTRQFAGTAAKVGKVGTGGRGNRAAASNNDSSSSHLKEIRNFGSNPGALRMFTHMPPQVSEIAPSWSSCTDAHRVRPVMILARDGRRWRTASVSPAAA